MKQDKIMVPTATLTKDGNEDLKKGEALGMVRTMPTKTEPVAMRPVFDSEVGVVDSPHEFQGAIGQAQMEGLEYVEVSERMFSYLLKNNKSNYLTYGSPGIKVYRAGTRAQMEREDRMSAEMKHEYLAKLRRATLPPEEVEPTVDEMIAMAKEHGR